MIDAGIKIIDRLIQLATYRERKSKDYFNNYIDPLYKDSEIIVSDYLKLFQKLIHKIQDGEMEEELIRWLELHRIEHLPLRMKAKSMLRRGHYRHLMHKSEHGEADKFQEGIWRLMQGGLALVETGHVGDSAGHTLLDMLYAFMDGHSNRNAETRRLRYLEIAQFQMEYIQKAWKDISDGYAVIKEKHI